MQLPKLCSLDVSFNRLRSLQNLHTAKELRELKIYNNKLTSTLGLKAYARADRSDGTILVPTLLSSRVFCRTSNANLEGLMLHENQIDCLSSDFLGLGRLKTLWINGNQLMSVANLTNCRLLVHLDLARNQLTGAASEVDHSLHGVMECV
jgi:Leucine-rich repeat (LRR) protein